MILKKNSLSKKAFNKIQFRKREIVARNCYGIYSILYSLYQVFHTTFMYVFNMKNIIFESI